MTVRNVFKDASKSIKDAAQSITLARRRLADNRVLLGKIAKALQPLDVCISTLYGMRVSATINDLDGFKDDRLIAILGRLIDLEPSKEASTDYPLALNRDFVLTFPSVNNEPIVVCLYTYVRTDSPTCRKVLKSISTRVVEDKTFELVCD